MNYETGLEKLKEFLGMENSQHSHFIVLEARLMENLSTEQRFGSSERLRSERAQIIYALNQLSLEITGKSFGELASDVKETDIVSVESLGIREDVDYQQALLELRHLIKEEVSSSSVLLEFETLQSQLLENLQYAQTHGLDEGILFDRVRVVNALNQLTERYLGLNFYQDLAQQRRQPRVSDSEQMRLLTTNIRRKLGFRDTDRSIRKDDFVVVVFETTTLFQLSILPGQLPVCFYFAHRPLSPVDLNNLRSLMTQDLKLSQRILLLVLVSPNLDIKQCRALVEGRMQRAYAYDAVVVSAADLEELLEYPDSTQALRRLFLNQIDLSVLSPFVTTGPTSERMFFGRENELRQVVEGVARLSFALIGGRRMGKTSMIQTLQRDRLPLAELYAFYHDCSPTKTRGGILEAVSRYWLPEESPLNPNSFSEIMSGLPDDKPVVILLDEADKIVPDDKRNEWQLFSEFRALAQAGRCQFVLTGERTLREAMKDPSSPLFNFANEILLGPLDFRAVEELVTRPMKQLEIELPDEKTIVDRIWAFTSGHPNVVQRLCRRLIERVNELGIRRITLNDVSAVIEDPGFQRDDFLSTYWEAATPLEKIISLLMSDNREVRTLRSLRQALEDRCGLHPSARETDAALQRLVDLRSILKRTPTGYEFAVKAFPRVVAGTMTLSDMLMILTEEYQERGK